MLRPPSRLSATAIRPQQTGRAGRPMPVELLRRHKRQVGTHDRLARQFPALARCRKAGQHRQPQRLPPLLAVGEHHHLRRHHRLQRLPNHRLQVGARLHPLPRRPFRTGAHQRLLPTPPVLQHGARPRKNRSKRRQTGQARLPHHHLPPLMISGANSHNPMWSIGRGAALALHHHRSRLPSRHHRPLHHLQQRRLHPKHLLL